MCLDFTWMFKIFAYSFANCKLMDPLSFIISARYKTACDS